LFCVASKTLSALSVAGVKLPPTGYIDCIASCVRACGGLFIADEVQTGFGRLGSCMWAFQYNSNSPKGEIPSFVPDIVTVGKPFGNGMPLAAVIATRDVSDAFDTMEVEYFNTFGGNPVSAAAGLAMLDVLHDENLQQNAHAVGAYIMRRLRTLQNKIDLIGDVRGAGLFIGIELVKNRVSKEPASKEASYLCTILKTKYQIMSSLDGPFANVFVIKPPMVFTDEDADFFIESFQRAILDDLPIVELTKVSHTPT
jgi:4-aminobutyrate aminotransferase-like enzyme